MQKRHILNICCIALLAAALVSVWTTPAAVRAQAGSAGDLINAVNAYRASNGLEPYSIDSELMALAQSHSEYQASIQTCTHQRGDGSGPGDHGISAENIACGPNLSVQDAIYYQWANPLHVSTILGPATGLVGAGVAFSGDTVYYTLAVKRLSGDFNYYAPQNEAAEAPSQDQQPTTRPVNGIIPSTPNSDGSVVHVIEYGETLVNIAEAYGISLSDLISQNQLDPNNPAIFEGQTLIIRPAFTATPFMTSTYTPRPPTRTPMPTRTPRPTRTPTPILSPTPTPTATAEPLIRLPSLDELGPARPVLAYTFIGISVVGLIVLVLTSFLPERKDKDS